MIGMEQKNIIENLKKPSFFGNDVKSVKLIQTHISVVALTGKYAYKIKKPVNFGFLDFSTLEKRKYFCEEEVRLNKRLCPDIYLDVLPITTEDNNILLNRKGKIIDYALKMKEFPQEKIMTNLLKKGEINIQIIEKICDILIDFYKNGEQSKEIDNFGSVKSVKLNIDENFEQTEFAIGISIPKNTYKSIQKISNEFLNKKEDIFNWRIKHGFIHDCHGDLHSGNIVVDEKIYIFDCIEFNERFRYCDVASDLSFLAMDLDYLNFPFLSSYLIKYYIEKSKDIEILNVINLYKSYRAYVRGKVTSFRLNDSSIDNNERDEIIKISKKYFELSNYYTSLLSIDMNINKPILFMISGLTGTGKSTLALKLAIDYNATHIDTDIIRKESAGINKFERHHDNIDTGLYSPKNVDITYDKMLKKAEKNLKNGKNIVLDATFQKEKYRNLVREISNKNKAILISLNCCCPEEIVKKWLEERLKTKSVSDGRWEVYNNQKKTFESIKKAENFIEFNTSKQSYDYRLKFFSNLIKLINEAS